MKTRIQQGSLIGSLLLFLLVQGCARSDAYKKDHEFYEETGEGYYSQKETSTPTDHLEKLKQPKKKLAVLAFWNDTPVSDETIGAYTADELKRALVQTRKILLPDDKSIMTVTKDFVEGDRVQVTQLIREGKRLGVNSIVVGRISKITFRQEKEEVGLLREAQSLASVEVEMKVFDVGSGREVHSARKVGVAQNTEHVLFGSDASNSKEIRAEIERTAVRDAIGKLVPDVLLSLDKMDWQGRVAKILGNKVYINAGKASGLLAGDILKVMSPGEEIADPVTRAYLGRSEGFLKGTLEVTEFIGTDSSMTLIHTGGNFQEGDVVRLY